MDLLQAFVSQLGGVVAGRVGIAIYRFGSDWIKDYLGRTEKESVARLLNSLGTASPEQIRDLVAKELPQSGITPERREEITRLILDLARGTRTVASQSMVHFTASRADMVEQVLAYLKPVRNAGEVVSPSAREWVLKRLLGIGTFGEVWLATHRQQPALQSAFKFFTHDAAKHWLQREQQRLIAAQNALKDEPNLVKLIDLATERETYPYLRLEFLPGGTLEDWILDAGHHRTHLRKDEVIRGIVRAMARAHEHGISHRDLKPANVLLTAGPNAQPKIGDFGLADVREEAGSREGKHRQSIYGAEAAAMVGTPMYWPPEFWMPSATRDPKQHDVFAIGVIWYQLLVEKLERPPYDFAEELRRQGQDSQTIALISRCLAGPDRRFKNAALLEEELQGTAPPEWPPVPKGCFDVSLVVKEYLSLASQ